MVSILFCPRITSFSLFCRTCSLLIQISCYICYRYLEEWFKEDYFIFYQESLDISQLLATEIFLDFFCDILAMLFKHTMYSCRPFYTLNFIFGKSFAQKQIELYTCIISKFAVYFIDCVGESINSKIKLYWVSEMFTYIYIYLQHW